MRKLQRLIGTLLCIAFFSASGWADEKGAGHAPPKPKRSNQDDTSSFISDLKSEEEANRALAALGWTPVTCTLDGCTWHHPEGPEKGQEFVPHGRGKKTNQRELTDAQQHPPTDSDKNEPTKAKSAESMAEAAHRSKPVPYMISGVRGVKEMPEGSVLVVKWGASWCGPCRQLSSTLKGIRASEATVVQFDVDKFKPQAQYLGIKSIPRVFVWTKTPDGWIQTADFTGARSLPEIHKSIAAAKSKAANAAEIATTRDHGRNSAQ